MNCKQINSTAEFLSTEGLNLDTSFNNRTSFSDVCSVAGHGALNSLLVAVLKHCLQINNIVGKPSVPVCGVGTGDVCRPDWRRSLVSVCHIQLERNITRGPQWPYDIGRRYTSRKEVGSKDFLRSCSLWVTASSWVTVHEVCHNLVKFHLQRCKAEYALPTPVIGNPTL